MNFLGLVAVALALVGFAIVHSLLRHRPVAVRFKCFCIFALLAVPSVLFAVYYLHVLPEYGWFYSLRSWPGSELLVVFLGCAGGAVASLIPRVLLILPLFATLAAGVVPYVKPVFVPLANDEFKDEWRGDACLQSTAATCGPASTATILRHFGIQTTEQKIARAAHSYAGGTEAWYLARYVRSQGLQAHFDFQPAFSPEAGQPAVVGVHYGRGGHFIAVLSVHDNEVTFADPLSGEETMTLAKFKQQYDFTGFHLVIQRPLGWTN